MLKSLDSLSCLPFQDMSRFQNLLLSILSVCAFTGVAQAQSIVLKDGTRLAPQDITIADGKISRSIKLSNGQSGKASVAFSDIDRLDWANPKELNDARQLMAAGKAKEAIEGLVKAKAYFEPFKEINGNPYNEIVFAHTEALDAAGDFDSLLRVLPEVNRMRWDDDHKLKLRIIKLNMDRRTSPDMDRIQGEAETILTETDDSAISARLWMTIGDIHTKKERYEEAFTAYLHVPVFYGSQASLVPQAELMAARSLQKLERFKDAVAMFQRIAGAYPGSEVAETAKKEGLTINGLENKPDKPIAKAAAKDSKK